MYIMCPQILVKAAQDEEKRQVGSLPLINDLVITSFSTAGVPAGGPPLCRNHGTDPEKGACPDPVWDHVQRWMYQVDTFLSENLLDSEQWKLFHKDRKRKHFLQYTYIRVFVHRLVQSILMLHHSLHMYTVNTPGEYFEPFYLELEFTGKEIEVCTQTMYVGNYIPVFLYNIVLSIGGILCQHSSHSPDSQQNTTMEKYRSVALLYYFHMMKVLDHVCTLVVHRYK